MNCVRCRKAMVILELEGVEVDFCFSCGGLWLDRGELEILLGSSEASQDLLQAVGNLEPFREKKIRCPVCRSLMEKRLAGQSPRVPIDRCPKLHGLWFDRDELGAVLSQARSPQALQAAALLKEIFRFSLTEKP